MLINIKNAKVHMKNLCVVLVFLVFLNFHCESRAENLKPTPTPTPNPFIWADWLTETENIWLRDRWQRGDITIKGGEVFIDIGIQYENNEVSAIPDTIIRLFKRYRQASLLVVRWSQFGSAGTFSHDYVYSLNDHLKLEQMCEVAAGRITLEQAWNDSKEVKPPIKK